MPLTMRGISGLLLLAGVVLSIGGVLMFNIRNMYIGFFDTRTYFNWERGLFMVAYVVAALGLALLENVLREADVPVLARLGATAFLIAAVLAVVAEGALASGQIPGSAQVFVTSDDALRGGSDFGRGADS